ncbi:MAG: sigma factor-like helix-turn-helix DNA-binding protein, partial [Candidatus Yanofskybacteria bacterium]|nr:sigma factor-like helix-turn-helix DNA-binding protein [Candidatus Yanofskybacteria bacterium]
MAKKDLQGLPKTVTQIVKTLSPRNRDIISRRFGLANGKRETLESIGKSYGITRERVRQIEEFTLNQLASTIDSHKEVQKYVSQIKNLLQHESGVMKEKDIFRVLSGNEKYDVTNAALVFLLSLTKDILRGEENDRHHAFWALDRKEKDAFHEGTSSLVSALKKNQRVIAWEKLPEFAMKTNLAAGNGRDASDKRLGTLLSISKDIDKNIFGEVGLATWPEIKPKGVRDKAYLIMKKEGQPRHFSEIAGLINKAGFDNKKVNIQTVHNELIKDERFVLVGRGM